MSSEKSKLFAFLDPRSFKLKTKIQLIIFSSVLIAVLVTIVLGFSLLKNILLENSMKQLEELAYLKSSEIEQKFKLLNEKLIDFSKEDKLIEASSKLIGDFHTLKDERYDLFMNDSLNFIKNVLEKYYLYDLSDKCPVTKSKIIDYFPHENLAIVAQYLYIARNPNLPGEKAKASTHNDNSSYAYAHASYHSYFQELCRKLGGNDICIIDPLSGDVVYSLQKNIDFGSNLYSGRLRNSPLALAFRKALTLNIPAVKSVDFSIYPPALDQPVSFLSVPVFSDGMLMGVMIVQLASNFFDHILYDDYLIETESSFEYNIIGKELYLRNNPRGFLRDETSFIINLEEDANRKEIEKILLYKASHNLAMLAQYPVQSRNGLISEQNIQIRDYISNRVFASVKSIEIFDTELFIVAKINRSEALGAYLKVSRIFLFVFIIILIIVYLAGNKFAESIKNRVTGLRDSLTGLYHGEQPKPLELGNPDELGRTIGAYNDLRTRLNETSEFAIEMSEGNFNHEFKVLGESDSLGKSLNVLKIKMIQSKDEQDKRQREDEIRNWLNTGIAKFNDLLRKNNNNIEVLSYSLIENLVKYIDANQGGVFLVEGDSDEEKHINLTASYAYDRRKYNKKRIEIGEGLLGNIYLEKKSIYLKDIPEDYMEIKSGMGQSSPRYLYITPLKVEENVIGMIEIGSLNELEAHHIELLERVTESIAGTFISVRLNMQTTRLLEESNRRTEEITQQEEEMRQNLEEMQATQEELARLRQDDEKRTREMQINIDNVRRLLKDMLDAIPGGYVLKDPNGIILLANQEGAKYYSSTVELMIGKTDYELLSSEMFEDEHRADLDVITKGERQYTETKEIEGERMKFNVTKKPFRIEEIHQDGILTIRHQV